MTRRVARECDAAHLSNAIVFVREEQWTDYAPFFTRNTPQLDTNIIYAIDQGQGNRTLTKLEGP